MKMFFIVRCFLLLQDIFNDVENDVDDDVGVELAIREYESRGGELYKQKETKEKKRDRKGKAVCITFCASIRRAVFMKY